MSQSDREWELFTILTTERLLQIDHVQYCRRWEKKNMRAAYYFNHEYDDFSPAASDRFCAVVGKHRILNVGAWQFAGSYIDNSYYYRILPDRPAFDKMLQDARNGKFDLLFVNFLRRFVETVDELFFIADEFRTLPRSVILLGNNGVDSDLISQVQSEFNQRRVQLCTPKGGENL